MKVPARDKFKGTLLGCAVGDALGAPLEGMDAAAIKGRYGRVEDFIDARFGAGRITDDTQMTIVLAQAILELGKFDREHAAFKFAGWIAASDTGVKEARGVGAGCRTACRRLRDDPGEPSGVDSAGCGAAMRASPIGLRYFHDRDALFHAAVDQALLTHTDPRAVAGSVAVACAVAAGILDEGDLDKPGLLKSVADAVEKVDRATASKIAGLSDYLDASAEEGFAYTGTGGITIETVPAALFAFIRTPYDLEETVVTAVNAGGDTDSIGAIAGAVSGAFNGMGAIPARWKENVEGGEYIESVAYRIFTLTPANRPAKRPAW